MKEYYFANYKLIADDNVEQYVIPEHLRLFEKPMRYGYTFRLHFGTGSDFERYLQIASADRNVWNDPGCRVYAADDGWVILSADDYYSRESLVFCSPDYTDITLCISDRQRYDYTTDTDGVPCLPLFFFLEYVFGYAMSFQDGMSVHASLIEKDGIGILFMGQSGIGKSTQAKLWKKYRNADFISGDRPTLQKIDGVWYACGMPWDGKDDIYTQKCVPVKAVVTLEQAPENKIRYLSNVEIWDTFFAQFMIPPWDKSAASKELDNIIDFSRQVTWYRLSCRPDQEAVELLNDTLYSEVEKREKGLRIKDNFVLKVLPGVNCVFPVIMTGGSMIYHYTLDDAEATVFQELQKGSERDLLIPILQAKYIMEESRAAAVVDGVIECCRAGGMFESA